MKRRSNARKCLLCLTNCFSLEDSEEDGGNRVSSGHLEMLGGGKCNQLQQQLEKFFVLRKILDIPVSWCEEVLQNNCSGEEGNQIGSECDGDKVDTNLVNWFVLCHRCMDTSVSEAWKIYQQITVLEVRMKEIKDQVKGRMLKEIKRPKNRSWTWSHSLKQQRRGRNTCGEVEGKIMNFMFPELREIKTEDKREDCSVEDNDGDAMEFGFELDNISNYSDDLSGNDIKPALVVPRRSKNKKSLKKKKNLEGGKRKVKRHKEGSHAKGTWYRCTDPKCKVGYRKREELEAHTRAHKEREEKGGEKTELDCPHCTFPAIDKVELERHIQYRHKFRNRPYFLPCPKCDFKVQDDFIDLKAHFDQEHSSKNQSEVLASDQPLRCPVCSKRCDSLKSFFVHQKHSHPQRMGMQVETLECNHCGMKFSTQLDLQIHVKRNHSQHKKFSRFICEECGKGFEFQAILNRHKIKHQNKKKRDYVCHLCGLDYAYRWPYESHCRKYHPTLAEESGEGGTGSLLPGADIEKELTCKYCDFTCTIKGIMIRHLEQHKQESGFKCNECGKCYVNDAGLRRHIKIIHKSTNEDIPCPYCLKPFKSLEYMRHHARANCKLRKLQEKSSSNSDPVVQFDELTKIEARCPAGQQNVIISEQEIYLPVDQS